MNGYSQRLLQGKRILIRGASGGAGSEVAKLAASYGAFVCCLGRDPAKVEKVRVSLTGGMHVARFSLQAACQDAPFDGIFDATGAEHVAPTALSNSEALHKVFDSSINGAVELCHYIGKRDSLIRDGGSVVFMSSVAAVIGTPGMTIYSASKGAVESLMRSAAMEWSGRRVRVNAIRAGAFASPMHSRITGRMTDGMVDDYAHKHPLGFGKAEDIANMAIYLLSDMGRWITGQAITVDGGITCKS